MAVGEKIKEYRENAGLKQRQLAESVGVSYAMINQVERGTKNPSLQVAYEIARVLGCSVEDFLEK